MIERPIIFVRFITEASIGDFHPATEWNVSRPPHGARPDQVRVRMGNPDLGEQRTSVVFEIRKGGTEGDVDVEVPASNLAEIQRRPAEKPAPAKGGAK